VEESGEAQGHHRGIVVVADVWHQIEPQQQILVPNLIVKVPLPDTSSSLARQSPEERKEEEAGAACPPLGLRRRSAPASMGGGATAYTAFIGATLCREEPMLSRIGSPP
jgi:hypothetical protein